MELRRQLLLLRSWARWIVIATIAAAVAAYATSGILPKEYQAEARLVVGQALTSSNPSADQFQTAGQLADAYAEVASDRPVLERVMEKVGLRDLTVSQFSQRVSVVRQRELPFINIAASARTPEEAAAIANAMAEEIVAISPTISGGESEITAFVERDLLATQTQIEDVQAEVQALVEDSTRTAAEEQRLETLEGRLVSLRQTYSSLLAFAAGSSANRVTITKSAIPPTSPSSPRPLFNTAIAGALALLLSTGVAYLWSKYDDTVKSPEDVERAVGLATIGSIARMPGGKDREPIYRLATLLYPRSPVAESFRALRTNVEFAGIDQRFRSILVSSSIPGEGKSVIAANLAVAFAQAGRSTLLVDADLRRPGLQRLFRLDDADGLTTLLRADNVAVDDVARATEQQNLRIITTGPLPPNPAELLNSSRMEAAIQQLLEAADLVIFDSPPIQAVTDAALLAARAEATILVVQSHRTREGTMRSSRETFDKVNAHVIGVVLNGVPARNQDRQFYGTYAADPETVEGPAALIPPTTPRPASAVAPGGTAKVTEGRRPTRARRPERPR